MKGVRNTIALLTATAVMAGAAPAQDKDKSASFDQDRQAYPNANITLDLNKEPQFVLGTSTRITGLIVDCLSPRQTWSMLNPSVPARNLPKPPTPPGLPVKAPRAFNNDLAVHEADFALIRFSFP